MRVLVGFPGWLVERDSRQAGARSARSGKPRFTESSQAECGNNRRLLCLAACSQSPEYEGRRVWELGFLGCCKLQVLEAGELALARARAWRAACHGPELGSSQTVRLNSNALIRTRSPVCNYSLPAVMYKTGLGLNILFLLSKLNVVPTSKSLVPPHPTFPSWGVESLMTSCSLRHAPWTRVSEFGPVLLNYPLETVK